ncbi:hypothetical protein LINPERHAP2_LOCUS14872 [Linum perenne]
MNPTRSTPNIVEPIPVDSLISSMNQLIREPSWEDIGWFRPMVGRWGDIPDNDDEDYYVEQNIGEEEEIEVPKDKSDEEEALDEGDEDN